MAAPTFVKGSAGSYDTTGAWSYTADAPSSAGNFYIVHWLWDGVPSTPPSITGVTNAEALDGTDSTLTYVTGSGPATGQVRIYAGRALNTSAMVISGTNALNVDHWMCVYEFSNVSSGTTIATVFENSVPGGSIAETGNTAAITDVAVTTLGLDRLALQFVTVDDDNAVGAFTGMSGGTWTEAVAEYADSAGSDACLQLQTAEMAASETIDGGSYTMSDADNWAVIGFALIGTTPSTRQPRYGFVHYNDPAIV